MNEDVAEWRRVALNSAEMIVALKDAIGTDAGSESTARNEEAPDPDQVHEAPAVYGTGP